MEQTIEDIHIRSDKDSNIRLLTEQDIEHEHLQLIVILHRFEELLETKLKPIVQLESLLPHPVTTIFRIKQEPHLPTPGQKRQLSSEYDPLRLQQTNVMPILQERFYLRADRKGNGVGG